MCVEGLTRWSALTQFLAIMARATMMTVVVIMTLPGLSVDGLLTMPAVTPTCRDAAVAAAANPRAQGFLMHNPRPCRPRAAAAEMCCGAGEGEGRDCGGQTELLDGRGGLRGRPASASAPKAWHPMRMLSLVAAAGIACQPGAAAAGGGTLHLKGPAMERTLMERTLVEHTPVERTLVQAWPRWQLAFTDDDELQEGELDGQSGKLAFADDEQEMAAMSGEGENEQQGGMIENKEPEIRVRGIARTPFFPSRVQVWLASVCALCLIDAWVFRQLTMPLSAAFLHGKVLRCRLLGHCCRSTLHFVLGALPPPRTVPSGALPNQRGSSPTCACSFAAHRSPKSRDVLLSAA